MDTDDDMPEDEFLETPEQALPGDLSRVWAIRSNLLHEREADELNHELAGDAPARMIFPWTNPYEKRRIEEKRRREQLEFEQAMLEISEHQDLLLRQINEEQVRIAERRKEIEDNALRLQDGRRVYVDGDRYRDGEGRMLTGADEAEAARQHEYHPDAPTWQEKKDIDAKYAAAEKLKDKIIADRESGQGTPQEQAAKLDGYEKEFAEQVQAKAAAPVTDYGSADNFDLSAVPAFTAAASPVSHETIRKLTDDDAGTQTTDYKKPPQPFGGGGMKPT